MRKANTQTGVSSAQSNDAPSVSTSKSVDASDMSGDAGADISDAISTGSDIAAASEGGLNPIADIIALGTGIGTLILSHRAQTEFFIFTGSTPSPSQHANKLEGWHYSGNVSTEKLVVQLYDGTDESILKYYLGNQSTRRWKR
eukprot:m.263589 g.263589  ORF g.263589 m.263589 type:complete len:143 (-) comp16227_c0_seq55:615-1043(-)